MVKPNTTFDFTDSEQRFQEWVEDYERQNRDAWEGLHSAAECGGGRFNCPFCQDEARAWACQPKENNHA